METWTWPALVLDQLTFHWEVVVRPRLASLTDEEYWWEPVPGCWSIRPRDGATTPMADGGHDLVIDGVSPEPDPPPVTTIAWRLGHLIVPVLGARTALHFGGPPADPHTWPFAPTAAAALTQLDDAYGLWLRGVQSLDEGALQQLIGDREEGWEQFPHAALVLHITREIVHHGAEILLLRDLYQRRGPDGVTSRPPAPS